MAFESFTHLGNIWLHASASRQRLPKKRSQEQPPLVTIFGGGIAGLSVAQECIERGMGVQLVEPAVSTLAEYESDVGGMAANQYMHGSIDLRTLFRLPMHPIDSTVTDPYPASPEWSVRDPLHVGKFEAFAKLNGARMRPALAKAAITETIDLEVLQSNPAPPAENWPSWQDEHGVLNETKLQAVLTKVYAAFDAYKREYQTRANQYGIREDELTHSDAQGRPHYSLEYWREILCVGLACAPVGRLTPGQERALCVEVYKHLEALHAARADRPADLVIARHFVHIDRNNYSVLRPGERRTRFTSSRRLRVEIEVVEQILPGEHGFRFFPTFYRNLFDTMKRTPVFDRYGIETQETAFDHLVPTADPSVAFNDGEEPKTLRYKGMTSLYELEALATLCRRDLGFTDADTLRMQVRMFRYLTSCRARRKAEGESHSFWDYLNDRWRYSKASGVSRSQPENGCKRLYSEHMESFLRHAPRALAAMSANEVDARSYANILYQLTSATPGSAAGNDFTLNGDTSQAWITLWKAYLKAQGVQFFTGSLERLKLGRGWIQSNDASGRWTPLPEFLPIVAGPSGRTTPRPESPRFRYLTPEHHRAGFDPDTPIDLLNTDVPEPVLDGSITNVYHDFFVLALPMDEASRLIHDAHKQAVVWNTEQRNKPPAERRMVEFEGPFAQLVEFDRKAKRELIDPAHPLLGLRPPVRDAATGAVEGSSPKSEVRHNPMRDIAGIQYFFSNRYRIGNGHVYFADSEWALTSISQLHYARDQTSPIGRLLGQVSIDIGDWYTPWVPEAADEAEANSQSELPGLASAWRSTREEIAYKTWFQVKEGLNALEREFLVTPQYYHLDLGINFETQRSAGYGGNLLALVRRQTYNEDINVYLSFGDMNIPEAPKREYAYTVPAGADPATVLAAAISNHTTAAWPHLPSEPTPQSWSDPEVFAIVDGVAFSGGSYSGAPIPKMDWLLMSPKVRGQRIVVHVEPQSAAAIGTKYHVWLKGDGFPSVSVTITQSTTDPRNEIVGRLKSFESPTGPLDSVAAIPSTNAFLIRASLPVDFAIANVEDGASIISSLISLDGGWHEVSLRALSASERRIPLPKIPGYPDVSREILDFTRGEAIGADSIIRQAVSGCARLQISDVQPRRPFSLGVQTDDRAGHTWSYRATILDTQGTVLAAAKTALDSALSGRAVIELVDHDQLAVWPTHEGESLVIEFCRSVFRSNELEPDGEFIFEFRSHGIGEIRIPVMSSPDIFAIAEDVLNALRSKDTLTPHVEVAAVGWFAEQLEKPAELRRRTGFYSGPQIRLRTRLQTGSAGLDQARRLLGKMDRYADMKVVEAVRQLAADVLMPVPVTMKLNCRESRYRMHMVTGVPIEITTVNFRLVNPERRMPVENRTPFLINLANQWHLRPGLLRTGRHSTTTGRDHSMDEHEHGRQGEIAYWHNSTALRRWVAAGTWMATHTRITSMEAANESAKHAVRAILHQLVSLPPGPGSNKPEYIVYSGQERLFGDMPEIMAPEDHEHPDLQRLVEYDEAIFAQGGPHIMDAFRLLDLVDSVPQPGEDEYAGIADVKAAMQAVRGLLDTADQRSVPGIDFFLHGARQFMDTVSRMMRQQYGGKGYKE